MLSNHSLDAAVGLASVLEEQGVALGVAGDTPLSELVEITSVPRNNSALREGVETPFSVETELQELSTQRGPLGISEHDVLMEKITDITAQAVGAALSIARNDIGGMVRRVVSEVEERTDGDLTAFAGTLQVKPVYHHKIWRNPSLEALVGRWNDSPPPTGVDSPVRDIGCGELEDLSAIFKTGITGLDTDIQAMLDTLGEPNLQELISKFYRNSTGYNIPHELQFVGLKTPFTLILIHLVAVHFENETPNTENMTLEEFNHYNTLIKVESGRMIAKRLNLLDRAVARKQLVVSYPNSDEIYEKARFNDTAYVEVNQVVYERWLEEGGCPEILWGDALGNQVRDYDALLANGDRLKRIYMQFEQNQRLAHKNQIFNRLQKYIGAAISKEIQGLDFEAFPCSAEEMQNKLSKHISHMCATDVENLWETVRHIVCNTIFDHTHGLLILSEFDRLASKDEDSDKLEIAFMVGVNYATDWVAKFIYHQKR